MPESWSSADDIASHLGVTKDTAYAWIADENMPAHRIGRLWKFQASEVDDWVRRGNAATAEGQVAAPARSAGVGGAPCFDSDRSQPTAEVR